MNVASAEYVLMLTALDLEYQAVRAQLTGWQKCPHQEGTLFETARLPGCGGEVAIGVTGEGNLAAAVLAERAISTFAPYALLFVGVAGALKDDINLGDIVVGTKTYAYHGGKDSDDGFAVRPRAWPAPHELEQLARHISRTKSWSRYLAPQSRDHMPEVHFRPIAAGEVVLNSRDTPLAKQLRWTYNDAAAIEMESAGAAQAGHLNRSLPVLTIRGISDKADGAKDVADAARWQPAAAAHAAAFAVALAKEIIADRPGEAAVRDSRTRQRQEPVRMNVTAQTGGIAYGVLDGNMYINQPAGTTYAPGLSGGDRDNS